MSEPLLYLEDLVKAETPAPSPKAKAIASGVPKTPKPSSKAQAIASGPAKVGDLGLPPPPAQQTLKQGSIPKTPAPSAGAKAAATQKYEYWSGSGTPPASGNWERGPEGGWRRPEGSGGGGTGEAETLLEEMKTPKQEAKDATRAQQSPDRTVSSGEDSGPVSSAAAKIEEAKQAAATPPASEEAKKIAKEGKTDDADKERKAKAKLHKEAEKQAKEEAASQAKEGEKPKKPTNAEVEKKAQMLEMEADNHRQNAKNMLQNVQAHMELADPETKAQLEKIVGYLEEQSNLEGEVSQQDKDILKMAQQAVKHHGVDKAPKDEEQKPGRKAPPKVNYGRVFDQARAAGEQIGGAAATLEGGGEVAVSAINYGSSGAVRGGHHLLGSKGEKKAADSATKKAPKKGAEVEQSSMKTEKSLGIYLDLQKAVQPSHFGNVTPTEERARIKHESSYAKRPVGVANEGIVTEDDEDKGKDWKHADEDSVQADVDQKLKAKEKDEEEEEKEVTKSLTPNPISMLKSLNSEVREELRRVLPTDLESTFMIEILEYDPIVVSKGQASIKGKDRHRFNEWAHNRLAKSISSLHERVRVNE